MIAIEVERFLIDEELIDTSTGVLLLTKKGRDIVDNGGYLAYLNTLSDEERQKQADQLQIRLMNQSIIDTNQSVQLTNDSIILTNQSVVQTNLSVEATNLSVQSTNKFQKKTFWATISVAAAAVFVSAVQLYITIWSTHREQPEILQSIQTIQPQTIESKSDTQLHSPKPVSPESLKKGKK
jgi:hypothetical protein